MGTFKIFYSWQSDLPGNKTRYFIRECIDEAINLALETEAIEAERDEATFGTTGSPNIVTTLFSKIDECDLFIADVSLCFSDDHKREKRSPNPNVMLELGYAVKTLEWERVICLCNMDYGDQYPFDIAHNRITSFSLEGKSRKEVLSDISRIIFTNIRDLRDQSPRTKKGTAAHIVGTYDFEKQIVLKSLNPVDIGNQESYVLHNEELKDDAARLVVEIQELSNKMLSQGLKKEHDQKLTELPQSAPTAQQTQAELVQALSAFHTNETPVIWKSKKEDKGLIKKWLGVDVSDDFFELGGLKRVAPLINIFNPTYSGLSEEKDKYKKLLNLFHILHQLDVRTNYLKTFDGMCYIPLAIQNISEMQDENIRIVIGVDKGIIVEPEASLIWKEYDGLQGVICRDDDAEDVGLICELFNLKEDGIIHVEKSPYDSSISIPRMPIITPNGFSQPDKTEDDYKQELEEYIASTEGKGYYEFTIETLRPNECKWLCFGLLIKPDNNLISLNYQIHSSHSRGDLNGTLELQT